MDQLRRETEESHALKKKEELLEGANSSFGYGGKFGVEQDRMDQSAMGHDYVAKVEKHSSQTDYSTGFGGKYGVQNDRVDKVLILIVFGIYYIINNKIISECCRVGPQRKSCKTYFTKGLQFRVWRKIWGSN